MHGQAHPERQAESGLREGPLGAGSVPGCGLWGEGPAWCHFLSFPGWPLLPLRKHLWGWRLPSCRFSKLTLPTCLPAPQRTPDTAEIPVKTDKHVTPFPPTAKPRPHCALRGPNQCRPVSLFHPLHPLNAFPSRPVLQAYFCWGTSPRLGLCGDLLQSDPLPGALP